MNVFSEKDGWSDTGQCVVDQMQDELAELEFYGIVEFGREERKWQNAFRVVKEGTFWLEDSVTVRYEKKLKPVEAVDVLERGLELEVSTILQESSPYYVGKSSPGSFTLKWLPKE